MTAEAAGEGQDGVAVGSETEKHRELWAKMEEEVNRRGKIVDTLLWERQSIGVCTVYCSLIHVTR